MIADRDAGKLTGFIVIRNGFGGYSVLVHTGFTHNDSYFAFHSQDDNSMDHADQAAMFVQYHVIPNLHPFLK